MAFTGMNLTILGRLTKDPTLRTANTSDGREIHYASFSVAVERPYGAKRDANGDVVSDFFDVETSGKVADFCSNYIRKGQVVYLRGYMYFDTWESDGVQRKSLKVKAEDVISCAPRQNNQNNGNTGNPNQNNDGWGNSDSYYNEGWGGQRPTGGGQPYNNNQQGGQRPTGGQPYNNNQHGGQRPTGGQPYNNNQQGGQRPTGGQPYNNNQQGGGQRPTGNGQPYNNNQQGGGQRPAGGGQPYNNNQQGGQRPAGGGQPYNNNQQGGQRPTGGGQPYNNNQQGGGQYPADGGQPYNNNQQGGGEYPTGSSQYDYPPQDNMGGAMNPPEYEGTPQDGGSSDASVPEGFTGFGFGDDDPFGLGVGSSVPSRY